ncbi:DMT family transporter [Ventosimonas gracilis]|uniref:DMT family transporter n=1 Tax=Ventosimonas gracilis TaxID=1680762 RepID=UPI0009A1E970|nr:DMT family transporter [Ventosimonas gracilis]
MPSSFPFSTVLFALAALIAGALVPFQAGSNAALGRALGHPLWATVASLLVSLLVVLPVIFAMRVPMPSLGQTPQLPWWAWLGGVAGVVYITAALLCCQQIDLSGFKANELSGFALRFQAA